VAGVVAPDCHLSAGEADRATCFAKPAFVVCAKYQVSSAPLWDRWAGSVIVVMGVSLQVRRDSVANEFIENT
jgi:hypothetical protein